MSEQLREALTTVRAVLEHENQKPNGAICDTIWHTPYETLFDYIDAALAAQPASPASLQDFESRAMFVARIGSGDQDTMMSCRDVLALLGDCDYLATLATPQPLPTGPVERAKCVYCGGIECGNGILKPCPYESGPVEAQEQTLREALVKCKQTLEFLLHKSGVVQSTPHASEAIATADRALSSPVEAQEQPAGEAPVGIIEIRKPNPSLTCQYWIKHLDLPVGTHRLYARPQAASLPTGPREGQAYGYAKRLAEAIAAKHFPEVTQWRPLPDLLGVLTQIDNMTSALASPETPSVRGEINSGLGDPAVPASLQAVHSEPQSAGAAWPGYRTRPRFCRIKSNGEVTLSEHDMELKTGDELYQRYEFNPQPDNRQGAAISEPQSTAGSSQANPANPDTKG